MDLTGQIAMVTGASSGIGNAVARALHSRGAKLALVGRSRERLQQSIASIDLNGTSPCLYEADLASDSDLETLTDSVRRDFTSVDILVHSAAAITLGSVEDACVEDLDMQYRVNLRAPFVVTKAMLPMLKKSRGQVVFVNSFAGLKANANAAQYSATKHGLRALADGLRDEVNAAGVRVLSIFSGRTRTPMQRTVMEWEKRPWTPDRLLQPEDIAELIVGCLCLPRTGEVIEIMLRPMWKC
jgi:short-subunit dehydrogenase